MSTVLVVDDDDSTRSLLATVLRMNGLNPVSAKSLADALSLLECGECSIVLADVHLGDAAGPGLLRALKECCGSASIIAMTGADIDEGVLRANGASEVLRKPFGVDAVTSVLRRSLGRQ
jgi:DNA-binding NtrC family response regulator